MTNSEIEKAQALIDNMDVGDKRSLKEIYAKDWHTICAPKTFGKTFKSAVKKNILKRITHIGIRNNGRCDEYEKL